MIGTEATTDKLMIAMGAMALVLMKRQMSFGEEYDVDVCDTLTIVEFLDKDFLSIKPEWEASKKANENNRTSYLDEKHMTLCKICDCDYYIECFNRMGSSLDLNLRYEIMVSNSKFLEEMNYNA